MEGHNEEAMKRQPSRLVGQFKKSAPFDIVVPLDSTVRREVLIPGGAGVDAPPDSIVSVEITRFGRGEQGLRGRVLEVLGFRGDFGVDIEIMIRKHQIPFEFPLSLNAELEGCSPEVLPIEGEGRSDFRALPIVTIDGETAQDFDDAVHVEMLAGGNYQLGVHIADVSHYVRKDTLLDQEALRRGTSVYFPGRAVPMLPEALSNGICSLKPQVDRLVLSVLMEINPAGQVERYSFHEGVIHSRARMTYTSVARILEERDPEESERYRELVPHFERMQELARVLSGSRRRRGSIDFDLPEPVFAMDETGRVVEILRSVRNGAHRLIEEFMLAANETVARFLFDRQVPSLYRVHEEPDPLKVLEFNNIALGFGFSLGISHPDPRRGVIPRIKDRSGRLRPSRREMEERRKLEALNLRVTPHDYQKLVDQLAGKPAERLLSFLLLRSLAKAGYSPQNRGHFGLASDCYTHFTSPIRRYPDLMVHRLLRAYLNSGAGERFGQSVNAGPGRENPVGCAKAGKAAPRPASANLYSPEELERIALHSSLTERRAAEAEQELAEVKVLDFMTGKLGDDFEGVVIQISREGMTVELLELCVEGLIPIATLVDDDYRFRDRPATLTGRRFGRTFQLGDRLSLVVDRVDRFFNRVELSLAGPPVSRAD